MLPTSETLKMFEILKPDDLSFSAWNQRTQNLTIHVVYFFTKPAENSQKN